jgi:hypothetical protein
MASIVQRGKNLKTQLLDKGKYAVATLDTNIPNVLGEKIKGSTGSTFYGADLRAPPPESPATEAMVLTFVGNGNQWTLVDKVSTSKEFQEPNVFGVLQDAYITAPVVLEQYSMYKTPQAIPGAIAKTTSYGGDKIKNVRGSIISILNKSIQGVVSAEQNVPIKNEGGAKARVGFRRRTMKRQL